MIQYRIKIELLSDLSASDGGVYNSALDRDVCYDAYGLPYIPAKRLRGCLRECAKELMDWGVSGTPEALFGDEKHAGKCRIGNAYLEHAEEYKAEIIAGNGSLLFHEQNVLKCFTYVRTQTGINYETGVADKHTLRTERVVNKGTVFFSEVSFSGTEEEREFFEKCCAVLRHIGMIRTRGMGEVKVSLVGREISEEIHKVKECTWEEGADCLNYTVFLEEPVLCKSVRNDESKTMDYIEGGKILGMVAQHLRENELQYTEFVAKGELYCTNAYPTCSETSGERMFEVPACFYSIKNDRLNYVDKAHEMWKSEEQRSKEENIQLNAMKHCYVWEKDEKLIRYNVETEKRYHYRRPLDKSCGHVTKDGVFYQLTGIAAGQRFAGSIYGTPEQIKTLYELMTRENVKYIGASKHSEYGKVIMECLIAKKRDEKSVCIEKGQKQYLMVKLEAPTVVYNNNAMYSVDIKDLVEEINATLGIAGLVPVKKYVRYTTLGGYNVTWGCRKPTLDVFDKGTVLVYETDEACELPGKGFLGERNAEGYGEFSVQKIEERKNTDATRESGYLRTIYKLHETGSAFRVDVKKASFAQDLCEKLLSEYIQVQAAQDAGEHRVSERLRPTVSNLTSMCDECSTLDEVRKTAKSRFEKAGQNKQEKLKEAEKIFGKVASAMKSTEDGSLVIMNEFEAQYGVNYREYDMEKVRFMYLRAYLLELKYRMRPKKEKNIRGEEA